MSEQTEQFDDPLEDYSVPALADPLEAAIHDTLVDGLQTQPCLSVSAGTTVRGAMKLMVGRHSACVLVEDAGQLVGVFADRDVLDRVALEYDRVIDGPVRTVMSRDPVSVLEADPVAKVI